MPDRLLREFREPAEPLVPLPDLGELQRRGLRLRRVRIAAGAAVLASALAIGGAVATSSINGTDSIGPAQSHAEETASGFLDAYGAFDTDRAISYLTDNAITETFGSALVRAIALTGMLLSRTSINRPSLTTAPRPLRGKKAEEPSGAPIGAPLSRDSYTGHSGPGDGWSIRMSGAPAGTK